MQQQLPLDSPTAPTDSDLSFPKRISSRLTACPTFGPILAILQEQLAKEPANTQLHLKFTLHDGLIYHFDASRFRICVPKGELRKE
eukprot:321853-Rhodomonas_salina.1